MRPRDRWHLNELVTKAETGRLDRASALSLFILVRGEAPVKSMLRDVGHTIAHDDRDRGFAVDYLSDFVSHLRATFESGGVLEVGILFEIHALIDELADVVEALGLTCRRAGLHQHHAELASVLGDLVDGTRIRVKHDAHVEFHVADKPSVSIFFGKPVAGVVPLPVGIGIAIPLFTP